MSRYLRQKIGIDASISNPKTTDTINNQKGTKRVPTQDTEGILELACPEKWIVYNSRGEQRNPRTKLFAILDFAICRQTTNNCR